MSNKFLDKEGLEYYHETLNDNYLPFKYDKEKNSAVLRGGAMKQPLKTKIA